MRRRFNKHKNKRSKKQQPKVEEVTSKWDRPTWVKENNVVDYLSEDDDIPNQKYVCLSFCALRDKQREELLRTFCQKNGLDYTETSDIIDKWTEIDNPMKSIKIRGSYSEWDNANDRVKYLRRTHGGNHFIYVGEVGKWGPFDPDPDKVQNQNYYEQQLNALHEGYEMNRAKTKEHFETRKQELVRKARLEGSKWGQDHLIKKPEPLQAVEQRVKSADEQIEEFMEKIKEAERAKKLALEKLEYMKEHPETVVEAEQDDIEEVMPDEEKKRVLAKKTARPELLDEIDAQRKPFKIEKQQQGSVGGADGRNPIEEVIIPSEARKDIQENYTPSKVKQI